MPDIDTPHFSLPLRFEGGRLAVTEQDSIEEIGDCVETVLRYRPGDRDDEPEFGTPDQAFEREVGPEIEAAIAEWEPRADTTVDEERDLLDDAISRVSVELRNEES